MVKVLGRMSFLFCVFILGRPLVRLGFAYLYLVMWNWLLVNAPFGDIDFLNFLSDSLAVNSGSIADSNSIGNIPVNDPPFNINNVNNPQNLIPLDVVDQFRLLNQETKLELFARIRLLENRLIDGLPPQMNFGEYEALVRGFLDDTLTIDHYRRVLSNELFDLRLLEFKANLLEQLINLLMSETTERLTQILADSSFREGAIRTEALSFINDFMSRLNLTEPQSQFEKSLVEAMLRYWIHDAQQNGNLSAVYREFPRYFLGN